MYNSIICRYHEIATKGDNRTMFENKLIDNLKYQCAKLDTLRYIRVRGRIYIRKKDDSMFTEEELAVIKEGLHRCSGLESFSTLWSPQASTTTSIRSSQKKRKSVSASAHAGATRRFRSVPKTLKSPSRQKSKKCSEPAA